MTLQSSQQLFFDFKPLLHEQLDERIVDNLLYNIASNIAYNRAHI